MRADDGQRTDVPELVRIVTELSAPDRVVAARSDAQYATDIATAGTNELTNSGILSVILCYILPETDFDIQWEGRHLGRQRICGSHPNDFRSPCTQ
jgi:hypothetical protein